VPTRKQRRREAKTKRHEYEMVYIDGDGNELDEIPEELEAPRKEREERRNGAKTAASKKPAQTRGGRPLRIPQPPSWKRSGKRALILGAIVFIFFSFTTKKTATNNPYATAAQFTVMYTLLFIPFTYAIDRFAYRRYQTRQGEGPPPRKKR
jgi:hypothetical protein